MKIVHRTTFRSPHHGSRLCSGTTKSGGIYLTLDVTEASTPIIPKTAAQMGARAVKLLRKPSAADPGVHALIEANRAVGQLNESRHPHTPLKYRSGCALAYLQLASPKTVEVGEGQAVLRGCLTDGCTLLVISDGTVIRGKAAWRARPLTGDCRLPGTFQPIELVVRDGDTVVLSTKSAYHLTRRAEFLQRATASNRSVARWMGRQQLPKNFGLTIAQVVI